VRDKGSEPDTGRSDEPSSGDHDAQLAGAVNGGRASALLRETAGPPRRSRRDVLTRAGVAAVAGAGALTLLEAREAQANNGGNFVLGQGNTADATTSLSPTTAGVTESPLFKVDGSNLSGTSTTMIVNGAPGPQGFGLVVNGGAGTPALSVNGASTPTTVGLAIAASASGAGVLGIRSSASGAGAVSIQSSVSGSGAVGISSSNSGAGPGVRGTSGFGTGVAGISSGGAGIVGASTHNRGGLFSGGPAQVQLVPSKTAKTHPTSGKAGDLFVDKSKRLWFCKGGTNWKQLA
jgi:hypothetical protein